MRSGGPPITAPKRAGFGTSLLKLALGDRRIEFVPEGLSYEIDLALDTIGVAGGMGA